MDNYKGILAEKASVIDRSLTVSNTLLLRLSCLDFFADKLKGISSDNEQRTLRHFMHLLAQISSEQIFGKFLSAIRDDGQEHVANIFCSESAVCYMSDEHYRLLTVQRKEVCKFLDPPNGVLDDLVSAAVFRSRDRSSVLSKSPDLDAMSAETVDILARKDDSAFDKFIAILDHAGQDHVAGILATEDHSTASTRQLPMSTEHRKLIIDKQAELAKWLDANRSVTSELVGAGIFNRMDESRVNGRTRQHEKAMEVLDILIRKPDSAFSAFCEILTRNCQGHVVNILTGEGDEPLSPERASVLRKERDKLVQTIDLESSFLVTDELYAKNAISLIDKQHIEDCKTCIRRCELLLDILAMRANSAFDAFLEALKATGQEHVVTSFQQEVKGIIRTIFRHDLSADQRLQLNEIVRNNLETLVGYKLPNLGILGDIMEKNGFDISEVLSGSILITFRCFGKNSLNNLKKLYVDKTLGRAFSETLVTLFGEAGLDGLELHIRETAFEKKELMSPAHRRTIEEAAEHFIVNTTLIEAPLLSKLSLSPEQINFIVLKPPAERLGALLGIISRRPDKAFGELVEALRDFKLHNVANYLQMFDRDRHTNPTDGSTSFINFLNILPAEMLEQVLMYTFVMFFKEHLKLNYRIRDGVSSTHRTLSAVSYNWWQTMRGWPESNTRHWFRHRLRHHLDNLCGPYALQPSLRASIKVPPRNVYGIAHCDHKLFIVFWESNTILVFGPNYEQLPSITVAGLRDPRDVVACVESKQLYILDYKSDCVWRASIDGARNETSKWLSTTTTQTTPDFEPRTLSLARRRLLVTTRGDELRLFGPDGVQLKRVSSPGVKDVRHAVETARETFVVAHLLPESRLSEVDADGCVIHEYAGVATQLPLGNPCYLALDSCGRVLLADWNKNRVLLLSSELKPDRILLDVSCHRLAMNPVRMCYVDDSGLLVVASWISVPVQVFSVRRHKNCRTEIRKLKSAEASHCHTPLLVSSPSSSPPAKRRRI